MPESFDLLTMGRIGGDGYPPETGVPLRRAESFGRFPGGTATDAAVAATVISRTGADRSGAHRTGEHTGAHRTGEDSTGANPTPADPHQAPRGSGAEHRGVTPVADSSRPWDHRTAPTFRAITPRLGCSAAMPAPPDAEALPAPS